MLGDSERWGRDGGGDIFHINSRLMAVSRPEACEACSVMANTGSIKQKGRNPSIVDDVGSPPWGTMDPSAVLALPWGTAVQTLRSPLCLDPVIGNHGRRN